MSPLIVGLLLFLGVHTLPTFTGVRAGLVKQFGAQGYRGLFSLVSLAGLSLIIYGKAVAPYQPVWPAWTPGFHLSLLVMPIVFILLAAANMPGHIRARLRHPMLIGVALWAAIHLSVNGDLASIMLFGGFLLWAALDLVSASARGQSLVGDTPPRARADVVAVLAGSAMFVLVAYFHPQLFGPAVLP